MASLLLINYSLATGRGEGGDAAVLCYFVHYLSSKGILDSLESLNEINIDAVHKGGYYTLLKIKSIGGLQPISRDTDTCNNTAMYDFWWTNKRS